MTLAEAALLRPVARTLATEGRPWLAAVLRPHRRRIAVLVGLGLVAAGAALVPPYLTKLVIDRGLTAGDPGALIRWSLALFGMGVLSLGLGALTSVLHMRASVAMLADLRAALARAVLGRSPAWRAERQTGELMARLDGDAGEVQQFAFNALLTGSGALLRLAGGAFMLFWLSAPLAAIALVLTPAEIAFFAWARPRTEALARASREARGALASRLSEAVQGMTAIQAARGEEAVTAGIGRSQAALNAALIRAQLWGEATRGAPALIAALGRSAVFVAGGLLVIRGQMSLGGLIAFLAYLGFLTGPAQSLIGLWHARARLTAALDRLDELMAPDAGPRWPARPVPLPPGPGALRLEGITLLAGGRVVVEGLTRDLPAGARIRVAGPSGAGKTSLLALFQRHADPAAGRILLDGIDIRRLSREDLRAAIAYVPQRPFLVAGTLRENLALAGPATEAEMAAALDLAELTGRFAPHGGLEARLGENGLTLSGGERQRLCLARTLLTPFRALILDEALSEVDPPTAARILAGIDWLRPGATRLVATHGGAAWLGPFDAELDLACGSR